MNVNRLTIKLYIEDAEAYEITNIVPVFHRWIREDAVPGLLIDVADYKHVPDGPGIILIGHEVDYALDEGYGRRGFFIRRKRTQVGALAENLQETLAWAVQAGQLLQQDSGLTLLTNELEISFPDRLNVPNDDETFTAVQTEITPILQTAFNTDAIEITNTSVDERRPLTLKVSLAHAPAFADLNEVAVSA